MDNLFSKYEYFPNFSVKDVERKYKNKLEFKPLVDPHLEFRGISQIGSSYYDGQWRKGTNIREGYGIEIDSRGGKYEGYWKNNKKDLMGREISYNGHFYEGEFSEGLKTGYGEYIKRGGLGNLTHYKGQFCKNKKEGEGCFTYEDGSMFSGQWIDDARGKFGELMEVDGTRKVFSKEKGLDSVRYPNGDFYRGNFHPDSIQRKNPEKHGYGVLVYANGDCFKGFFKKNKREGSGILTHGGKSTIGFWKDDVLQKTLIQKIGRALYYLFLLPFFTAFWYCFAREIFKSLSQNFTLFSY
jgi:hypothetical protein